MAGARARANGSVMINEAAVTAAFSQPQSFVAAGGGSLAYWRFGSGPDVVLVHGWPLHAATFRRIIPALAKRFTLHVFDLPGVGHSSAHGPAGFLEHAAALRAAMDSLGLDDYALLAHDSGGVIARLIAADNPQVHALVLAGTEMPHHRPVVFALFARLAKLPGFRALLLGSLRSGALRRSMLGFGGCFTDPAYVDGEFKTLFIDPLVASPHAADGHLALLKAVDFSFVDTLVDVHARIAAPVQLVWGTRDPFFPIAKARHMIREFTGGGAELVEIAGARLFPQEDHPEAFVGAVLPFLERHTSESARRCYSASRENTAL